VSTLIGLGEIFTMRHLFLATCIFTTTAMVPAAHADAEFGCKVLLCAASENPSWRGVPYCVPVMAKLYSMMNAWSFTWPVCSSAGTGGPGYEPYEDCPDGWQANVINTGSSSGVVPVGGNNNGQHVCQKFTTSFFGCNSDNRSASFSGHQSCLQTIPRPLRVDPYYFDIPEHKRVYFNVR
jgi:hypothetical protein